MKEQIIKGLKFLKTNVITTTLVIVGVTSGTVLAANLSNNSNNTEPMSVVETSSQVETESIVQETVSQVTAVQETTKAQEVTTQSIQKVNLSVAPVEIIPVIQNAENAKYFTYTMVGGGSNIYITGYNGNESNVVVPSTIDGYKVTGISDDTSGVFNGNTNIKSITFPEGLTYIGACTCRACVNLVSVSLPSTVTTIKHGSFMGCKSLLSIKLPSSINNIDTNGSVFIISASCDKDGKEITNYIHLIVSNGSYAMQYAINNNIPYTIQ